jgi:hypothetical protein
MSQRIRGKEATVQIVVDGDLKGGTFAKVTEFTLTPRTEIVETPFLGEVEDDLDIIHKGFDFSFQTHAQDSKAIKQMLAIVARERARTAHPAINVVVTFEYRSSTEPAETIVLESCFMKMDSTALGGADEYVTHSWSGKCKTVSEL